VSAGLPHQLEFKKILQIPRSPAPPFALFFPKILSVLFKVKWREIPSSSESDLVPSETFALSFRVLRNTRVGTLRGDLIRVRLFFRQSYLQPPAFIRGFNAGVVGGGRAPQDSSFGFPTFLFRQQSTSSMEWVSSPYEFHLHFFLALPCHRSFLHPPSLQSIARSWTHAPTDLPIGRAWSPNLQVVFLRFFPLSRSTLWGIFPLSFILFVE